MGQQYPVLTYRGDVTDNEESLTGQLCGWDETFRLYEIADVVYTGGRPTPPEQAADWEANGCPIVPDDCRRDYPHSHVYLQPASAETIKAKGGDYALRMRLRGLL